MLFFFYNYLNSKLEEKRINLNKTREGMIHSLCFIPVFYNFYK